MINWIKNLLKEKELSENIQRVARIINWSRTKIDSDSSRTVLRDSNFLDFSEPNYNRVFIYISKTGSYASVDVRHENVEEEFMMNRTDRKYILDLINKEVNRRFGKNVD